MDAYKQRWPRATVAARRGRKACEELFSYLFYLTAVIFRDFISCGRMAKRMSDEMDFGLKLRVLQDDV